jgi:hypothetical protein
MKSKILVSLLGILFSCALSFAQKSAPAITKAALQPGQASGTLSVEGKNVTLTHAGVFVDSGDESKPTVLVLSDQELPISGWKSGSDMTMYRMMEKKFNGISFWINGKGEVERTDYYMPGSFPTGSSGIFELKLDGPATKTFIGTANATAAAAKMNKDIKLDARFHAVLK